MIFLVNIKLNTIKEWSAIILIFVGVFRLWSLPSNVKELNDEVEELRNDIGNVDKHVARIDGFVHGRLGENMPYNSSDGIEQDACRENEDNPVRFAFVEED